MLALGVSCRGFFVNPTLKSMSVAPTSVSIIQGQTRQLTATGTYDDNSTKDLSGSAAWTTSDSAVANVNSSGLVTAAATIANPPGTATITATSGTITATSAITVNTGPLTAIDHQHYDSEPSRGSDRSFHRAGNI